MAFDYFEDEYEENESWDNGYENYETITDIVDGKSLVKEAWYALSCDSVNGTIVEDGPLCCIS